METQRNNFIGKHNRNERRRFIITEISPPFMIFINRSVKPLEKEIKDHRSAGFKMNFVSKRNKGLKGNLIKKIGRKPLTIVNHKTGKQKIVRKV